MHLKIIVGVFSMFTSWAWMEMKLEITFACILSTNLREKTLYTVNSTELFKLIPVYVLFSVLYIANKI